MVAIVLLFGFLFSGCDETYLRPHEELVVAKILKSELSIYYAQQHNPQTLLSSDILYTDYISQEKTQIEDILSLTLHVGEARLSGYGYDRFSLQDVLLDFDLDIHTKKYIYDYQGYMYDTYHDRYQFSTPLSFVGFQGALPHKGVMHIVGEEETLIVTIMDAYYIDIAIYNHYDSYYDRVIHTSWHSLGFN